MAITRIRLGNCSHLRHLNFLNVVGNPHCDSCDGSIPDSAEHRILECPGLSIHRQVLKQRLTSLGTKLSQAGLPVEIKKDYENNMAAMVAFDHFLSETGLLNLFVWRPGDRIPYPTNGALAA